jgi:transcriptional regulator with XRE-family HTH domain
MTTYTTSCSDCGWTSNPTKHQARAEHAYRIHSCDKHRRREAARARRLEREAAVDRTPKPCQHKHARHEHGTHACYVLDRCRCRPCADANAAYEHDRARLHAYGRFEQRWVDAGPVREHIQSLTRAGLGTKKIGELAGYSQGAMTKLIYGSQGNPPTKRIRREHADAILAVRATIDTLAPGARTDGTGTRRRLQALMAQGWSQSKLAREIGYELRNFAYLVQGKREVTVRTARNVRRLYDRMWDVAPPRATKYDRGSYTRSVKYAAAHGWLPPLAWDDDTIDDPDAQPWVDEPTRTGGPARSVHPEDVEWLLEDQPLATARHIADRLHVTKDALQVALRRAGRHDLLAQLARNARLQQEGTAA